jgi:hypothetical protein
MLASLVKALMGIVSLGFLVFSGVLLYNGLGLWGFLLVLLLAGGVVYLLIFVIGTPEPEGGWWIVKVELEAIRPIDDEARFHVTVDAPGQDPVLKLALYQKAGFLLERQLHRTGDEAAKCDYELRLTAGVAGKETWRQNHGKSPDKKK